APARPARRPLRSTALHRPNRPSWRTTVNPFLNNQTVAPEKITLASGAVHVPRFSWRFRFWTGKPVDDSYGGKAVMDCSGSPAFAELALIPVLREHGFDGAVWMDTYRRCFRDAMHT